MKRKILSLVVIVPILLALCSALLLNIMEVGPVKATTNQPNQLLLSGAPASCSNSANSYMALFYGGGVSTSGDTYYNVVASAGTLSTFRVALSGTAGASKSYTLSVRKNGTNTSLAVVIGGASATTGVDTTHTVSVVAGDILSVESAPSGTPTARTATWCCNFTSTTAYESLCSSFGTYSNQNTTWYWGFTGSSYGGTTNSAYLRDICPTAGTLKNLYVYTDGAAAGQDCIVTVQKNGVDTSLTVTVAGESSTNSNTADTISLVAGDALGTKTVYGAGADSSISVAWGATFVATNLNESVLMCSDPTAMNTGSTTYQHLSVASGSGWSTEAGTAGIVNAGFIYKSLYVSLDAAPGAGKSYALTVRLNGASTAITVTVSEAATTGSDTTHTATTTAGVTTAIEEAPSDTPSSARLAWGIVIMSASPDISSVSPTSGYRGETGKSETIAGVCFTGSTAVSFGSGITVNSFVINSDVQITATITIAWDAVLGTKDVTVTSANGIGTLAASYTVNIPAPTVTFCQPCLGAANDSLKPFVLTGTGFIDTSVVSFGAGGITVDDYTVVSGTSITGHLSVSASPTYGNHTISVTTPGGTGTLAAGFLLYQTSGTTYNAPTLTNINPATLARGVTTAIVMTGTNYVYGTEVTFGVGVDVMSFTIDSSTQITAQVFVHWDGVAGARDANVYNIAGAATLASGFTVTLPTPVVSGLSHSIGQQGMSNVQLLVSGTGFFDTSVVAFSGTGVTVNAFTIVGYNLIAADISIGSSAALTNRDVSVTTPGGTGTLTAKYQVIPPTFASPLITSITVDTGNRGDTFTDVLAGSGLIAVNSVYFEGMTVLGFVVVSDSEIDANISIPWTLASGTYDVAVSNPIATSVLYNVFTVGYPTPTVTNISSSTGDRLGTYAETIIGTGFIGATVVDFGADVGVDTFAVVSGNQISASITVGGSAAAGFRDVKVTTPGGTGTLTNGFRVTVPSTGLIAPTVASLSVGAGNRGEVVATVLTGTGFTGTNSVSFGDVQVSQFVIASDTEIDCMLWIPWAAVIGDKNVTVTNPAGFDVLTAAFAVGYPVPTVTVVDCSVGEKGKSYNVVITGTGFIDTSAIDFGAGITVATFSVLDGIDITATVDVANNAADGYRIVTVTTPGGSGTLENGFEVGHGSAHYRTNMSCPDYRRLLLQEFPLVADGVPCLARLCRL